MSTHRSRRFVAATSAGVTAALVLSSTALLGSAAAEPGDSPGGPAGADARVSSFGNTPVADATAPMSVQIRRKGEQSVIDIRNKAFLTFDYPVGIKGQLTPAQKKKVKRKAGGDNAKKRKLTKRYTAKNRQLVGRVALANLFGDTSPNPGRFHGVFSATRKGQTFQVHLIAGSTLLKIKKGKTPVLEVVNKAKDAPQTITGAHKEHHKALGHDHENTTIPLPPRGRTYTDAQFIGHLGAPTVAGQPIVAWTIQGAMVDKVVPLGGARYDVQLSGPKATVLRQQPGINRSSVQMPLTRFAEQFADASEGQPVPMKIEAAAPSGQHEEVNGTIENARVGAADQPAQISAKVVNGAGVVTLTVDAGGDKSKFDAMTSYLLDPSRPDEGRYMSVHTNTIQKGAKALIIVGDSIASGEGGRWRATMQPQGMGKAGTADDLSCFWGADLACEPGRGKGYTATSNDDQAYFRDWGWKKRGLINTGNTYPCHRSRFAPGLWLADYLQDSTGEQILGLNYACSGATTENVRNGGTPYKSQPDVQAKMVESANTYFDVEYIVMNIGANDIGFSEAAAACISQVLAPGRTDGGCREKAEGKRAVRDLNGLPGKIKTAITDVMMAAPQAKLLIGDYMSPIAPMEEHILTSNSAPSNGNQAKNGQPNFRAAWQQPGCENKFSNDPKGYEGCFGDVNTYWGLAPGGPASGILCLLGCIKSDGSALTQVQDRIGAARATSGDASKGYGAIANRNGGFIAGKMNCPVEGNDRVWIHRTVVPGLSNAVSAGVSQAAAALPGRSIFHVSMKSAANGRGACSFSNDGGLRAINGNQAPWWWGVRPGQQDSALSGAVNGFKAGPGGQTSKAGLRAGFFTSWEHGTKEGIANALSGQFAGTNGIPDAGGRSGGTGKPRADEIPGDYQEALHPNARGQMAQGMCYAMAMGWGKGETGATPQTGKSIYCVRQPGHSLPAVSTLSRYDYTGPGGRGPTINRGASIPDKICLVADPNATSCPAGKGIQDTDQLLVRGTDNGRPLGGWTDAARAQLVWEDWE